MENVKYVEVTHRVRAEYDGQKTIEILRTSNGNFLARWRRPSDVPGSLEFYTTELPMTQETFIGTIKSGIALLEQLGVSFSQADQQDELDDADALESLASDRIDAECYRVWRDLTCYKPLEIAKVISECALPDQIDQAIRKLII